MDTRSTLLLIEILVFVPGFLYAFKRERIFGLYLFFLFLYAIMPQVGYAYFSGLSVYIRAYFGENVWFSSTIFIISSFLAIEFGFALFWTKTLRITPLYVRIKKTRWKFLSDMSLIFLVFLAMFELSYLILNFSNINWYTNQEQGINSNDILFTIFLILFKSLVSIIIVLYCVIKGRTGKHPNVVYKALFIVFIFLFLIIAERLGNRTDILALSLGILIFHLYRNKITLKSTLKVLLSFFLLGAFLIFIEYHRYKYGENNLGLLASIMTQDYYAPAHMLFAAVYYHLIEPIRVITSDTSNSLILLNHPYLQKEITDMFNPGVATRSAGYGFYILTEGYLMAGPFGFIYNSILIIFGWALWRKFATTNNLQFNYFILALMGCMIVNLVRGQGSYFIKYLYTFVLPGVFLYLAITSQSIFVRFKTGFPKLTS